MSLVRAGRMSSAPSTRLGVTGGSQLCHSKVSRENLSEKNALKSRDTLDPLWHAISCGQCRELAEAFSFQSASKNSGALFAEMPDDE